MGGKTRTSGQGRPKGTPNKMTATLKEMILGALDDVGGRDYLAGQAKSNPTAYLALLGKVLPSDIKVSGDVTINFVDEFAVVVVDNRDLVE